MRLAKTRETVLRACEHGLIDTPKGAFIGSFSVAAVQLLLTSIASDVVPVCRRAEVDERFVLAEADAVLPDAWARACLPFQKASALPGVMEWRCPGLPSLFTLTAGWHCGVLLRSSPGHTLACSVTGYRHCDPKEVRILNGVVYRKGYRCWRPVRDLNREPVSLDNLLSLALALGIEVESSIGWTFSRWLQVQMDRRTARLTSRNTRRDVQRHATHTAA